MNLLDLIPGFGLLRSIGVALMGIGQALGVSPAITAGAIVSGSYFGDKMSPLSDTTNLAPGTRIQYVVKPGDNLQTIASKFNSTAEAIALLNDMKVTDVLFVGRTLLVPVNIATPTISPTPNLTPATATPLP